jgi:hypothetical protein
MEKYRVIKTWYGYKKRVRLVHQEEIVEFLKQNPGHTENDIMYQIYDYNRNTDYASNKKYADCLRRALRSGKISRALAQFSDRKRYIYFAI